MGVKEDFVSLLTGASGLDEDALTMDDNGSRVKYLVLVGNPPHIEARDLLLVKGYDLVVSVDDEGAENKRFLQDVPLFESGRYLIKTWTVAKSGIDGLKLKQKADDEIKRVFKSSPTNQYLLGWKADNKTVGSQWIYSTIFTAVKRVYFS